MKLQWLLHIVILCTLHLQTVQGNERNLAKFTKVDCNSNSSEYLTNASCRVRAVRRGLYVVNLQSTALKPLNDVMIHYTLSKRANTFIPFLIKGKENFCDFLSRKHVSAYMKVIGRIFLPYSNVNSSCPLMGLLIVKDLPMNAKMLPSIWPHGEYRFEANLHNFDGLLLAIRLYFALEEKSDA